MEIDDVGILSTTSISEFQTGRVIVGYNLSITAQTFDAALYLRGRAAA